MTNAQTRLCNLAVLRDARANANNGLIVLHKEVLYGNQKFGNGNQNGK
jgi:hypothetical protein